jgi:hypothetical protein
MKKNQHPDPMPEPGDLALDHIVIAVSDLEQGREWFHERSGVMPAAGGPHPGLGTHNALFTVSSDQHQNCYVEILAPDPRQENTSPVAQGLAELTEPALFHWALRTTGLGNLAAQLASAGVAVGQPFDASRQRPDGELLEWQLLGLHEGAGAAPFFIDWLDCQHPAESAPVLAELTRFKATLPADSPVLDAMRSKSAALDLTSGPPALELLLNTPRGPIHLETSDPIGFRLR